MHIYNAITVYLHQIPVNWDQVTRIFVSLIKCIYNSIQFKEIQHESQYKQLICIQSVKSLYSSQVIPQGATLS